MIVYAGADYVAKSHDDHSFGEKYSWEALSYVNIYLWLHTASYDWSNIWPIWLHCNYIIHSAHKEIIFIRTIYILAT